MSHKNSKTSKKSPTKKHIESYNNDDNTPFEYIIKHKSKYNIHDDESDSESEPEYIVKHKSKHRYHKKDSDCYHIIKNKSNHCKYKKDSNHYKSTQILNCKEESDSDSESDTEYIIENKSKYIEDIPNFDLELFEYFFKNKCYKKICNYYEIDLNHKKNNCYKEDLKKNSIVLLKNMLDKYSNGRIVIFFQEEK